MWAQSRSSICDRKQDKSRNRNRNSPRVAFLNSRYQIMSLSLNNSVLFKVISSHDSAMFSQITQFWPLFWTTSPSLASPLLIWMLILCRAVSRPPSSPSYVTLSSCLSPDELLQGFISRAGSASTEPCSASPLAAVCWGLAPSSYTQNVCRIFLQVCHLSEPYVNARAAMHSYHWFSWNKQCNAYLIMHAIMFKRPLPSFLSLYVCLCLCSMDGGDADFLKTVSGLGCEIHCFDPSNSNASGGHLGNSLASNHGNGGVVSQHKMWLEWRAPKKRAHKRRGNPGGVSQTLADIMAALGHHTVRHARMHTHWNVEKQCQTNIP